MKVKIPRQIKIGAHSYHLSFANNLEERHKKLGFNDITNGIIQLEPKQMDSAKLDTLIHELLHVVAFYYCNRNMGEDEIQGFATGLTNLLDNLGLEFDWSLIKEE